MKRSKFGDGTKHPGSNSLHSALLSSLMMDPYHGSYANNTMKEINIPMELRAGRVVSAALQGADNTVPACWRRKGVSWCTDTVLQNEHRIGDRISIHSTTIMAQLIAIMVASSSFQGPPDKSLMPVAISCHPSIVVAPEIIDCYYAIVGPHCKASALRPLWSSGSC
ncbi:hypothetical protein ElyMa_000744900 [Elysia marginata]|uniref:Uncharacterized protein n=1 Tax=Elysia marginata TaxID=1093978 RepID=A0AAV4GNK8_9GAST|nr:hypothetical protein ElyMa_000744900 [Elysia marginata]